MATCPLIDYLAWAPSTVAAIAAAAVAAAGLVTREQAVLARALPVFTTTILAGSALSVVAILVLQGSC